MTNETLVKTATRILREPGLMKLNFQLNGLLVTGERLGRVAQAIDQGLIVCDTLGNYKLPEDEIPAGGVRDAHYTTKHNVMLFERQNYAATGLPSEETTIVHEATHAAFDLFARSSQDSVLAIDDESSAVLAAALYLKLCNKWPGSFAGDRPCSEAWDLADLVMGETDGFADKQTYILKPDQTQKLRAAVAQQWGFIKTYHKWGTEDKTKAKYVYDGVIKCVACWEKTLPPSGQ
jgi:hypothetical protein